MRFKIPAELGYLCLTCVEPNLSTDGHVIKCRCGHESKVEQWTGPIVRFARQVREEIRRAR